MSRSGITGDLAELTRLVRFLETVGEAPARALAKAAPKIQAKARAGYAAQKGPDGARWKRNKDGTYPSLQRPAALVTFEAEGTTLVGRGEDVLQYHQEGNERLPRRAVFPEPGTLPPAWVDIVDGKLRAELGEKK
ncbi:MAG: hypothetical protein ACMG6S_30800 [Byssovorax sp.]